MGAREPELFELLRMREEARASDGEPSEDLDPAGYVIVTRRALIVAGAIVLALCILSGLIGYALA